MTATASGVLKISQSAPKITTLSWSWTLSPSTVHFLAPRYQSPLVMECSSLTVTYLQNYSMTKKACPRCLTFFDNTIIMEPCSCRRIEYQVVAGLPVAQMKMKREGINNEVLDDAVPLAWEAPLAACAATNSVGRREALRRPIANSARRGVTLRRPIARMHA